MSTEKKYPISKANMKARRAIRTLVQQSEWAGHVSAFPIKVEFRSKSYMDGNWGTTDLKGKGKKKYIEIALDEEYMKTEHGRDLCMVIAVHELAHALTWSPNKKVEEANTYKYGVHGPDFGIVYAQLWTDVMEGKGPEDDNEV